MNSKSLAIRWTGKESKGYTDLFPIDLFKKQHSSAGVDHLVFGPKGEFGRARCRIAVSGNTAELDYEAFPDFNDQQGMCLGVLKLHFTNKRRIELSCAEWKDQGRGKKFLKAPVKIVGELLPSVPPYKKGKATGKSVNRNIKERVGQAKFRETLMVAYGGRCCISGCSVTHVLEGAHIDPFSGPASDHPQNGLLLRHDLHTLFDAGLLAIDPNTQVVHFAAAALGWPEYESLNKKAQLAVPVCGDTSCRPSDAALKRRWKSFKSRHPQ